MANKLAGQRAKFSKARANYFTSADDDIRQRAVQLMAEVLADAPAHGFSEIEVTQGEDVPGDARQLAVTMRPTPGHPDEDDATLEREVRTAVDTSQMREIGDGDQFLYAYGYRCAPDRIKIGSSTRDVVSRIAAQISTGTPDRPCLLLTIRTNDCRALERVLHGMFRLAGKQIAGAGAEWFAVTGDEVIAAYRAVVGIVHAKT